MFETFSQTSFAERPLPDRHQSHSNDDFDANPITSCDDEINAVNTVAHLARRPSPFRSLRSLSPEITATNKPHPIPMDIIALVARCLQTQGAANTLASMQPLCRETYTLITPILYDRLRVTKHSWDRLFTLFKLPASEIRVQALEDLLDGSRHPIDYSAYGRRRWLFSLIKHLELVSLGDPASIRYAAAINERLYNIHSQHLLSGLNTMHITEAYTARSSTRLETQMGI